MRLPSFAAVEPRRVRPASRASDARSHFVEPPTDTPPLPLFPSRSSFLYRHPYLLFSIFFPSFLSLELLAALAVYIIFVARAEPTSTTHEPPIEPKRLTRREESASTSADDDVKPLISPSRSTTGLPPLDGEDADRLAAAEERAARRMRLGPGGIGMSEAFSAGDEGMSGTGTDYDDDGGTEVGDSVSEVGAGSASARVVKEEDDDGEGTVAGVRLPVHSLPLRRPSSDGVRARAGALTLLPCTALAVCHHAPHDLYFRPFPCRHDVDTHYCDGGGESFDRGPARTRRSRSCCQGRVARPLVTAPCTSACSCSTTM